MSFFSTTGLKPQGREIRLTTAIEMAWLAAGSKLSAAEAAGEMRGSGEVRSEERGLSPEAVRMLTRMRELLQRGWTQKADARGRWGLPVPYASQFARRFCLVGALSRAQVDLGRAAGFARGEVLTRLWQASGAVHSLLGWNDAPGRTQEEVLRLLDGVLARVRK